MRTWMLAEKLVERGHQVTWWASTFSHQRKTLLFDRDCEFEIKPRFNIRLLHAGTYKSNFSFKRYLHHRRLAKKFRKNSRHCIQPDIIVCGLPIIHVAYEATVYANLQGIPIVIDVRDLWPDTIVDRFSDSLQRIARCLLRGDFARTKELLKRANSIVAISEGCLNWALNHEKRSRREEDKVFYTGYPDLVQFRGLIQNNMLLSEKIRKFVHTAERKRVFLFVGSFGFSYELQLVCDVAEQLAKNGHSGIYFAIAGDGEQSKALTQRVRSLPNLSLLGWINEHEIRYLLKFSHAGLVPCKSVVDAMPNKVFEYFSAGLPILSSLEGEMEEIIKEKEVGFSYRCGDVQGLYRHVLRLAEDAKLRNIMGANARKLFEERFSEKVVYSNYSDHIERIVDLNKRY